MADLTISIDIDAKGVKRGTGEVKSAVKEIGDEVEKTGRKTKSLAQLDFSAIGAKLKSLGPMIKDVGSQISAAGRTLTAAVTVPLAGIGYAIVSAGMEYDKALNIFQAVTKATGDEMRRAAQVAKELGADLTLPATSAKDAALAMSELGKAGLTANQAMDAAKGVLQLAAAGTLDEAKAAEIAANALNSFRLEASETVRVADLLAAASNASSAEVSDIADSLQQASAMAAGAKIPIEDLTTAIGLMANAGIKGSDAGTSLKTFIQRLQSPTDNAAEAMKNLGVQIFDADGKMRSMPEIIGQFEKALSGLTDEKKAQALNTIFGSDAIRAAQILFAEGTAGFEKMKGQITAQGAAADLAAAKTKGLSGQWENLKSKLETFGLDIYERIKGPLTQALDDAGRMVDRLSAAFGNLSPGAQTAVIAIVGFAAVIGPLLIVVGGLVIAFGSVATALGTISTAVAAAGGLSALAPILAVIGGALALVTIAVGALWLAWETNFGGIRDFTQIVVDKVKAFWEDLKTKVTDLTAELVADLKKFWEDNGEDIKKAVQKVSDFIKSIWTAIVKFWDDHSEEIKKITDGAWAIIKGAVKLAMEGIKLAILLVTDIINGDWKKFWKDLSDHAQKQGPILADIIKGFGSLFAGAFKLAFDAVWDLHAWLHDKSFELGKRLGEGLVDGIKSMGAAVTAAGTWLAKKAIDPMGVVFDVHSPSRVTHQLGIFLAEGLANGMQDGTKGAAAAAGKLSGTVSKVIKGVFGGDFQGFLTSTFDILLDRSKSFGDKMKDIFGGILSNWKRMLSDMLSGAGSSGAGGAGGGGGGAGGGLGGILGQIFGRTGMISGSGNDQAYNVEGRSLWKRLSGEGGIFGPRENVVTGKTSKLGGILGGIGDITAMVGGMIGGRVGGVLSSVGSFASMGAMFGPWGAAIGAGVGLLVGILGGDPKRKRDKKEKMPQLAQGFTDSFAELKQLISDVRSLRVSPDSALAKATEIRAQIAGGFGIQFESKKYGKLAKTQIQSKLAEADALIAELRKAAEIANAAGERDRRMLPEFASGVFMSPAFRNFRRRNGMLAGAWTGRDSIPALLAPAEMVLNPMQQDRVRQAAGFDAFKNAGIPGYAGGGMVNSQPAIVVASGGQASEPMNLTLVFEHAIDANGMVRTQLKTPSVQKDIRVVIEDQFANDELKLKRRT